jgi:hypothetical protein
VGREAFNTKTRRATKELAVEMIEYQSTKKDSAKALYFAIGSCASGVLGLPAAVLAHVYVVKPLLHERGPQAYLAILFSMLALLGFMTFILGHLATRISKSRNVRGLSIFGVMMAIWWVAMLLFFFAAGQWHSS